MQRWHESACHKELIGCEFEQLASGAAGSRE